MHEKDMESQFQYIVLQMISKSTEVTPGYRQSS